jgi:type IV pilus assembly protein PilY1
MRKSVFILFIAVVLGITALPVWGDDTDLFMTQMPPDALIILDMSYSMNSDPAGKSAVSPDRKIDIARTVLKDLLDDNDNGTIDGDDEKSLNARLGYMRFWNAYSDDTGGDTKSGSVQVLAEVGSHFKDIWDKINDGNSGAGGTPLAASLAEAKTYFINSSDSAKSCRKKFVILITDGEDTYACSGTGSSSQTDMYKRRMKTVQRAKELNAAGFEVFVIGFGESMPDELKRTLNWAAKYGGTDNPLEGNSEEPPGYDLEASLVACGGNACNAGTSEDPANHALSGYAFLPENAEKLAEALKSIFGEVVEASYSFGAPSIPSLRLVDQDLVYFGSFEPNLTPFWQGHLKAYRVNEDGSVPVDANGNPGNPVWETSTKAPGSRKICTYLGQNENLADTTNAFSLENSLISPTVLGLSTGDNTGRDNLINHIRGSKDAFDVNQNGNTTEVRNWNIGDIFHSSAVVVGSPSSSFEDVGSSAYGEFSRSNSTRTKVILVGANDGMLHAFSAETGEEVWAYIPNAVLKQLKTMKDVHTYYVDSSPKVADVWFDSDPSNETKKADEWKTVLVCGLRKGGKSYFALDITDTTTPRFLWEFPKPSDTATLAEMGESWSEPAIGRVKIEVEKKLVERWVAFVGAGFDPNKKDTVGRGFFVIDIKTGEVLWKFSYVKEEGKDNGMTHSMAAPPKAVDLNFDGYVDRVYIGDLGGQMWVFDVSFDGVGNKSNSKWTGKRLFLAPKVTPEKHPIYYQPSVALDPSGTPWVFFGTGDREDPLKKNIQDRFYAVKDDDAKGTTDSDIGGYPYSEEDLTDVTSNNAYTQDALKKGWFIVLEKGEKVLARPMVYNRIVYFTTFAHTDPDPCKVAGTGKLYSVEYLSGGGALNFSDSTYATGTVSGRSVVTTGSGLPSGPVITINTKGVASVIVGTVSGQIMSKNAFSPARDNEILYWREVIP